MVSTLPRQLARSTLMLTAGWLLTACSTRDGAHSDLEPFEPVPSDVRSQDAPLTFHRDVEPILQANCQRCHRVGGIAPIAFDSYPVVKSYAARIAAETSSRRMPPWGAFETDECRPRYPFASDVRLSDAEVSTFAEWFAGGAPEGDPDDAPADRDLGESGLANLTMQLRPRSAWVASGDRDQFRCFVIDPGFANGALVSGMNFVPGNPKVVHHALIFVDPNRESEQLAGPDGSYDCFGGPRLTNTGILNAWAPGVPPLEAGPDTAILIPGRARLVLQIHYHPVPGTEERDQSTLEIRLLDGTRPKNLMQLLLIGNFPGQEENGDGLLPGANDRNGPEFRIPAGETDQVETLRFTLPETFGSAPVPDLKVVGVAAHMHYVGYDMKIEIEHASPRDSEPSKECMLETPRWDFNWQRGYFYDVPIERAPEFRPGDRLHLRCRYNNSMSNPAVVRALAEQGFREPRDVVLGEETLDEMCLAVLAVVVPSPF